MHIPLYFFKDILNYIHTYTYCIFSSTFCLFFHRILMISTWIYWFYVLCYCWPTSKPSPYHNMRSHKQFSLLTFCSSVLSYIRVLKFLDITGFPHNVTCDFPFSSFLFLFQKANSFKTLNIISPELLILTKCC